jgi:AcrR family transcriptional regulator
MLHAAAEEFAVHGYEGASLQRIASRVGVSKGSLYYYFDDKADLFETVADETWRVMLPAEPVDLERLDAATFWPTLRDELQAISRRATEFPWAAGVAKILYHPTPSATMHDIVSRQLERSSAWIRTAVRRGQTLGVIRTDLPEDLLAAVVMAAAEAADRWAVDHWSDLPADEVVNLSDRIFGLLRAVVTTARGAAPEEGSQP